MLTLLEVLKRSAAYLGSAGVENPRLDAELLLCAATGLDRLSLYVNFERPMAEQELGRLRPLLRRRRSREPLSFITGRREFYSRLFEVGPGVLVPRPETELVVEEAVCAAKASGPHQWRVLDVGTGCGNIALTLAAELPRCSVTAVDISARAVKFAKRNAASLGVAERVSLLVADLFSALGKDALFDAIVSNPPYVSSAQISLLPPEIRNYEPAQALDGGPDGLRMISRIAGAGRQHLAGRGFLIVEIGAGQAEKAGNILADCRFSVVRVRKDYSGIERVVVARPD